MPEVQRLLIQEGNETYEVYVEAETTTSLPEPGSDGKRPGEKGIVDVKNLVDLEKARKVIRGYTLYVLGAFKNFGAAEIQEVNIKFGFKFSGTAGIPYITQGSAENNMEIEVKCKFPDTQNSSSSS
jgi:hypothetical protein